MERQSNNARGILTHEVIHLTDISSGSDDSFATSKGLVGKESIESGERSGDESDTG